MKKLLMAGIFLVASACCIAQTNPVKWVFAAKKIAEKTYELRLSATVAAPWHIYSQTTPDGGPLPTKISFTKNPLVTLESSAQEKGKLIKKFEEVFDVNVIYFDRDAEFVQLLKLKSNVKTRINGSIEFMACNDVQCLPPSQVPFQIELN